MCDFYSCIVMRDGRVLEAYNTNSHDKIIFNNGLKDTKLEDRDFVRIEILPNSVHLMLSKDRSNWRFKVDEPKSIPTWFEEDSTKYTNLAWSAWQKFMDEMPFIDNVESVIPTLAMKPEGLDETELAKSDYYVVIKAGLFGYLFDYAWHLPDMGSGKLSTLYIGTKIFDRNKLENLAKKRNINV